MQVRLSGVILLFLCLNVRPVTAQTVVNETGRFAWNMNDPAITLVLAQGYTYKWWVDTAVNPAPGVPIVNVTCTGTTGNVTCQALGPQTLSNGLHTLQVSAMNTLVTPAQESGPSQPPLSFTFTRTPPPPPPPPTLPPAPTGVRITP